MRVLLQVKDGSVVHWNDELRVERIHQRVGLLHRLHRGTHGEELDDMRLPVVRAFVQLHAGDAVGLRGGGFVLHALHCQFAGVVHGLGELRQLHVVAQIAERAQRTLVGDVIDARAHDHFHRPVARLEQHPEILPRQVGGEGLAAHAFETGVAGAVGNGGADGHELQNVLVPFHALDLQPQADHAVGAQQNGLLLHAAHGEFARLIHGLRQHVHLHAGGPLAVLNAEVVDAGADHQAQRLEPGLAHHDEFIHRQVGGEDALVATLGAQALEPLHRVGRELLGGGSCGSFGLRQCGSIVHDGFLGLGARSFELTVRQAECGADTGAQRTVGLVGHGGADGDIAALKARRLAAIALFAREFAVFGMRQHRGVQPLAVAAQMFNGAQAHMLLKGREFAQFSIAPQRTGLIRRLRRSAEGRAAHHPEPRAVGRSTRQIPVEMRADGNAHGHRPIIEQTHEVQRRHRGHRRVGGGRQTANAHRGAGEREIHIVRPLPGMRLQGHVDHCVGAQQRGLQPQAVEGVMPAVVVPVRPGVVEVVPAIAVDHAERLDAVNALRQHFRRGGGTHPRQLAPRRGGQARLDEIGQVIARQRLGPSLLPRQFIGAERTRRGQGVGGRGEPVHRMARVLRDALGALLQSVPE